MTNESLLPAVEVPDFEEEKEVYDVQYRRSIAWDPLIGDFVRDSTGKVAEANGKEAYTTWCYKSVLTERYNCLAYSDEIGAEMERAMSNDDIATVESMVRRTVTEALLVNPRTEAVRDISFRWDGDEMHCSITVKGVEFDDDIVIEI